MTWMAEAGPRLAWRWLVLVAAVGALAAAAVAPSTAGAAALGELNSWGAPGFGDEPNELLVPMALAVDPNDADSVYVSDLHLNELSGEFEFRLRKLSSDGSEVEATNFFPIEENASGWNTVQGIAVSDHDPGQPGRVYVLRQRAGTPEEIKVFSTEPSGGALVAPGGGPATVPVPSGGNAIIEPVGIAFDPSSDKLVIAGHDASGHVRVEKVDPADGSVDASLSDTAEIAEDPNIELSGLAVAADGAVFLSSDLIANQQVRILSTMPPGLGSISLLPGVDAARTSEIWKETASEREFSVLPVEPQLAVSPDGKTLYFSERIDAASETTPGKYLIRGYSVENEATEVLYGGGSSESCEFTSNGASIAAVGEGRIFVLDHGYRGSTEQSFGARVIELGPGGEDCPAPRTSFTANSSSNPSLSIGEGDSVTFTASTDELNGATPTELDWNGGGAFAPVAEPGSSLSLTKSFDTPGTYKVSLQMKVSGSTLGNPPKVVKTIEVEPAEVSAPTITSLNPTHGPAAGANQVVITGTEFIGLTGPAAVKFGGTNATAYTVDTPTQITATAPAGTGTVNVSVTNSTATSANTLADNYTYDPATQQLKVVKSGSGSGSVTSSPNGIDCGVTCVASFSKDSKVKLTATAASGSSFAGWSGAGCSGTSTCEVTMSAAREVTATFDPSKTENPTTPVTPTLPSPPPPGKTPQEILREKRQKALKKCRKLHGKAKSRCIKRANQIGKPKKKGRAAARLAFDALLPWF